MLMEFKKEKKRMVYRQVPVTKFFRRGTMERLDDETWEEYKISRKAHNKAMKIYLKLGPGCTVGMMVEQPQIQVPVQEWPETMEELDDETD